jgi:hypothetical protein
MEPGVEPESHRAAPEYPKQIITFRGMHFSGDCCIWETALGAQPRYIAGMDSNVALAL